MPGTIYDRIIDLYSLLSVSYVINLALLPFPNRNSHNILGFKSDNIIVLQECKPTI